jgi:hypothetical protein
MGTTVTTNATQEQLEDLTDLILVRKNINNARRAVEIDPTTWSSLLSLTIAATSTPLTVVGDENANPKAIEHIKDKIKEWHIEQSRIASTWKGLVDGRCFIEKYIQPETNSITEISHLAFDEYWYNFLELKDPKTGKVLGYKQKAKIYPVPSNWENTSFDMLKNRQSEIIETTFTPDPTTGFNPVFQPIFFPSDGNSEGLVFKVLDDVYVLKSIKNMMIDAAKMAAVTTGVQVGNKDFPFKPYLDSDTNEEKISKSEERMAEIGDNFKDKFKKQVILHDGGVSTYMVGNGQLVALQDYLDYAKQEIRSALLTPDSRFESASSNRAVAQEQMSGSMGQVTVVDYINNFYIKSYYEHDLINHELALAGYQNDIGLIHLEFGEQETENEMDLANIAATILKVKPDLFELVAREYYPRIAPDLDKFLEEAQRKEEERLQQEQEQQAQRLQDMKDLGTPKPLTPENLPPAERSLSNAVIDPEKPVRYINTVKKLLAEEGVIDG